MRKSRPVPFPRVWLDKASVDHALLVNRDELREQVIAFLTENLDRKGDFASLGVTGERGVGKSILMRRCLADFEARHPGKVLSLVADARLAGSRRFFMDFIRDLVKRGFAVADRRPDGERDQIKAWLRELETLSQGDSVSETNTAEIARQYGANVGLKAGLFHALEGSGALSWQGTQRVGSSATRVTAITPELCQRALSETFRQIARWTDLLIVVFFDDIDQLREDPLAAAVRNVLSIEHCLRVVHVRTESMDSDIRREIRDWFTVEGMTTSDLERMFDERARRNLRETDRVQVDSDAVRHVIRRLCEETGNPLTALSWFDWFAASGALDVGNIASWNAPATLLRVAKHGAPMVPRPMLEKVTEAADRQHTTAFASFRRSDLEAALGDELFQQALSVGALLWRDRGNELLGLRLHPELELFRPSVMERLARS